MHFENTIDLKAAITAMEQKKEEQERALIHHFNQTYDSLKPINMIRSTLHEIAHSEDIKTNLIGVTLGAGAGIISRHLIIGKSHNFLRRIAGNLLELAVVGIVTKKSDSIKHAGKSMLDSIFGARNK